MIPPSCSDSLSCVSAINAAIAACGPSPCALELEAGTYILEGAEYGPRVIINGAHDLSITGAGDATVLVANISNVFSVSGSSSLRFSSFAVDMERLPFTYGQVTSTNATSSLVTFNATSTYRVELARHPWLSHAQGVISFDVAKDRYGTNTDIYALENPIPITYVSSAGASAQLRIETPLVLHDWVVIRHQTYGYNAFSIFASSGISVSNVTLWAVAGMGLYTDSCTGIDLDGLRILKKDGRPMSITADGVHFSNTRGGDIHVRNCVFDGQGDDGLNAPTLFQFIISIAADGLSLQVGGRGASGAQAPFLRAGDVAQFFSRETLLPLGTAAVAGIGPNNTIQLSSPAPPGASIYGLVNDANEYASTLTVTDSVFKNNRARGALLKQSNVFVARNIFDGCSASAAKTETDGCYWMEGHPVSNWSFVDNTLLEVNFWKGLSDIVIDNSVPIFKNGAPTAQCTPYSAGVPGAAVQRGLNISGNAITQISGEAPIGVYSADGVEVRGNTIIRESGTPTPAFDIEGFGVVNAVLADNVCDGRPCTSNGMGERSAIEIVGQVTALPSPEQLQWMDFEVGAMITFNLQTVCVPCGHANATKQKCQKDGCLPSLSSMQAWALDNLSTDSWLDVAVSFKSKYAVLVADHMSGFTLWPTKVHNYSIAATRYGKDVVAEFRASAAARGIAPGVFYSTHFNWVLGMNEYRVGWPRAYGGPALTQSEYEDAAIAQLQELSDYGPWAELWFDGGANVSATPRIPSAVRTLFPDAMCHSCSPFTEESPGAAGTGRGIRWNGNEEGQAPLPSWGAADASGMPSGNATGVIFDPPSCDTVLEEHYWFYENGDINTLRSTCALVNVYLTSVGRASNLILNMAPDATGKIQDAEVTAYAALGGAIDCLFNAPITKWSNVSVDLSNGIAVFPVAPLQCGEPTGCALSLVIEEELSLSGQRISGWIVEALVSGAWAPAVAPGMPPEALTGVGHKRIISLHTPSFDSLRLRVTSAFAAAADPTAPITLRAGALYNRTSTAECLPSGCKLVDY